MGMFFICKRDGTYRGAKIYMCFKVKVPHGACVFFFVQRQMALARSFIKPEDNCIVQIH